MNHRDDLYRLVARIAPDPGPGLTPIARELLEEIVSAPAPRNPLMSRLKGFLRSRPRLAVAAAPLTPVLLVVGWLLPGTAGLGAAPASAALDIKRQGDHYVVMVKDLSADPAMYQRELRERGLDVEVRVEPVAPPSVGEAHAFDGTRDGHLITAIAAPGTCRPFASCAIGFRIPVTFRGHATVYLGRMARPGERYGILTAIDLPGEPFHCVDYVNKTVTEVMPMLVARGVRPEFTSYATRGTRPSAPGDWYVYGGFMTAAGQAVITVNRTPNPSPRPKDAFCPRGQADSGRFDDSGS
ncbi:hypothetical protein N5079_11555 [Planotetraspora sp. A-T 1434]|uniref:hypothetical protein n=1 Tax=Planotetraspora sp. A-T 1434 TaxID=2979219 RepID=UPI0021BF54C9|nr:hypothetical protein [Planotetraspora sp. A-T 1434]MCT9930854.1 hypothetical protein [Planotetraspora sp. A-T 1434]